MEYLAKYKFSLSKWIYFNPSKSGECDFVLTSNSRNIKLNIVNCSEDPCSLSKTRNNNINSGYFLGSRNNADLNFKTNNKLNMKLDKYGHLDLNEGKSLRFGKLTKIHSESNWGIEDIEGKGLNFYKPWPQLILEIIDYTY